MAPDGRPFAVIDWEAAATFLDGQSARVARKLDPPGDAKVAPYIGVFASARDSTRAPRLHNEFSQVAKALGRKLAQRGFSMLTGGCPGIVDEAQAAFKKHRIDPARQRSVGVRIMALEVAEPPNPDLDIEIRAPNFGSRLELMHRFCDGAVFLPGGLGSNLELAFFLQYSQVAPHERGMPICLLPGRFWNPQKDQLARMRAFNTVSEGDDAFLHWVEDEREAINILLAHNGNRTKVVQSTDAKRSV